MCNEELALFFLFERCVKSSPNRHALLLRHSARSGGRRGTTRVEVPGPQARPASGSFPSFSQQEHFSQSSSSKTHIKTITPQGRTKRTNPLWLWVKTGLPGLIREIEQNGLVRSSTGCHGWEIRVPQHPASHATAPRSRSSMAPGPL